MNLETVPYIKHQRHEAEVDVLSCHIDNDHNFSDREWHLTPAHLTPNHSSGAENTKPAFHFRKAIQTPLATMSNVRIAEPFE